MVSPRKSRRKSLCFSSTDDVDAGAREQEAEHHAGRPAAGDAAARGDGFSVIARADQKQAPRSATM